MTKTHNVQITITNNSTQTLTFVHAWFDSGRLADGQDWPATIAPGQTVGVHCYERDWSLAGCSGWAQYSVGDAPFYFAFSNPSAGSNKVGFGNQTSVWDNMDSHYDNPAIFPAQAGSVDLWLLA